MQKKLSHEPIGYSLLAIFLPVFFFATLSSHRLNTEHVWSHHPLFAAGTGASFQHRKEALFSKSTHQNPTYN